MNRTDVRDALERLIAGGLSPEEAVGLAKQLGYQTFADMCEEKLPERLPRVRLERNLVRARIAQAIEGQMTLSALRAWAEELAAVLERHELGVSLSERRRLSEALQLVAVATDTRIFRNTQPVLGVLRAIERALGRRRAASNVATLYGQLFYGQPELHLLQRRLEEAAEEEQRPGELGPAAGGPPSYLPPAPSFLEDLGISDLELDSGLGEWNESQPDPGLESASALVRYADVVALNRPYEPGTCVHDYDWVVAFSVATRSLVAEDAVPNPPESGFLERAREIAPNFNFARYAPEPRRDKDGVLEIVVESETVGRAELAYASKLFAMVHSVGRVTLEGRRLTTICVAH